MKTWEKIFYLCFAILSLFSFVYCFLRDSGRLNENQPFLGLVLLILSFFWSCFMFLFSVHGLLIIAVILLILIVGKVYW
jgi:hypothetical protein